MKKTFVYRENYIQNDVFYDHYVVPVNGFSPTQCAGVFKCDPIELGIWIDIYARQSKEQVYFYDGNVVREYANGKEI